MEIRFRCFNAKNSFNLVPIRKKENYRIWESRRMLESPGKINSSGSVAGLPGESRFKTLEVYSIRV
jgi:hypothetical protein